jgi:lactoylglutathione lyase
LAAGGIANSNRWPHVARMSKSSELDTETVQSGLRIELFVDDVARSASFYRDVLGFETLREAPSGYTSVGRGGAVLGLNGVAQVPLDHPARPRQGHAVGLGVEIVIIVDDVAALHVQASGAAEGDVTALVAQPWALTDFRVTDPDGYYIRITGQSARI